MVREVLSIGVGGCGIYMAHDAWNQFMVEHKIDKNGTLTQKSTDNSFQTFFEEIEEDKTIKFKPRTFLIDVEPDIIDEINNSVHSVLFKDSCIAFNNPTHHNFASGYKYIGNQVIENIMDKMRIRIESCDKLQGFLFYRSVSGGTGSGLSPLIIEELADISNKYVMNEFTTYPTSNEIENEMVLYNTLLSYFYTADNMHLSLVFDNEKLRSITERYLKSYLISLHGYVSMNEYASKILSGYTLSYRTEGEMNVDMNEHIRNMIPFPSLHYVVSSFAPIQSKKDVITKHDTRKTVIDGYCRRSPLRIATDINTIIYQRYCAYFEKYVSMEQMKIDRNYCDVQAITSFPFIDDNLSIKIIDDIKDIEIRKYMAVTLNYRGNIKSKHVQAAIQWLKTNKLIEFVEWCPTGFKCGLDDKSTPERKNKNCIIKQSEGDATMFGSNTIIINFLRKRIIDPYKSLLTDNNHKNKHLYIEQGMELKEFEEAQQHLENLYNDYVEVNSEQVTDEADDS